MGDENDKALAQAPIADMDPDGDFVSSWLGIHYEMPTTTIVVTDAEAELVQVYVS